MISQSQWIQLRREISQFTGYEFSAQKHRQLEGGDINQAFQVTDGQRSFFVKFNAVHRLAMFSAEAHGLKRLEATKTIRVPQVVGFGTLQEHSFLVLEYLSMGYRGNPTNFAKQLARLHLQTSATFGFELDNFIGSTEQPNSLTSDWCEFFGTQRIGFQLQLLARKGVRKKLIEKGLQLIKTLDKFFASYSPKPALIHGDLWQGNHSYLVDGTPVIYDPACYYADHEAELAMMELFGHIDTDFLEAYTKIFPIDCGYQERKALYNLYHLLNHANLFGGHYVAQSEVIIDRLLA